MADVIIGTDLWDDDSPGVISAWLYEDGDSVPEGAVVAEIMNEKISFEIIAPSGGVLTIEVPAESEIKLGQKIASINS
jgi:pyruvate/2-oxoglutarate dehydrogenase complex dihydrolipoamide acyltransferase (E2) component